MPDTIVEEPTYTQTKQEVLDKLQSHIDAVAELKDKLAAFDEASGMPLKIAFMVASAHDDDPHISIQVGSSFDPILFGQVLSTACSVNPHTVLGLMEGLAGNPDTKDAMNAALIAMLEAMQESGDSPLALATPKGNA